MLTVGRPRGISAKIDWPTSVATLAACTLRGRRKSTTMPPSLIRVAMSLRPLRLTEPSSPCEIQM